MCQAWGSWAQRVLKDVIDARLCREPAKPTSNIRQGFLVHANSSGIVGSAGVAAGAGAAIVMVIALSGGVGAQMGPVLQDAHDEIASETQNATLIVEDSVRDPEALKDEAVWAGMDIVLDAYGAAIEYWPESTPEVRFQDEEVGGGSVPQPPKPDDIFQPESSSNQPATPPPEDAARDRLEEVTGHRSNDAVEQEAPDAAESTTTQLNETANETRQAESSSALRVSRPEDHSSPAPATENPQQPVQSVQTIVEKPASSEEVPPAVALMVVATGISFIAVAVWIFSQARGVGRWAAWPVAALFSRQTGTEVLQNPVRARIHVAISQHPGITAKLLSEVTGIRASSLRYHLGMLEREELIHAARDGKILHYHPAGADPRAKATQCLFLKHRGLLAKTILGKPGASQQRLAREMGLPASVVCTYVHDLTRAGLVHAERAGRYLRYFPTDLLEGIQEQGRIPDA